MYFVSFGGEPGICIPFKTRSISICYNGFNSVLATFNCFGIAANAMIQIYNKTHKLFNLSDIEFEKIILGSGTLNS